MNYQFKNAIKEELLRLEDLQLRRQSHFIATIKARDYVQILKHRIMNKALHSNRSSLLNILQRFSFK